MPREKYREVPLSKLRLDPENPRLSMDGEWASEPELKILREFYLRYNLIELARSFADKGFTPRHAEALLVVSDPTQSGNYVVVEGNRRLATLKLLTNSDNRKAIKIKGTEWEDLARETTLVDPEAIPVIVYPSREELNDYLGFRHITGPSPWRPEAKARFIARLLGKGEEIGNVARRIGSNYRTVRRYAEAHAIFVQAGEAGISVDEVEAGFGVFYNALDWEGMRSYLGLGPQIKINRLPKSPVPTENLDRLRELIGLLYGDSSRKLEKVIAESRDLSKLSNVLGNDRATANLLRMRDLNRAWRVSGGGRSELIGLLVDLHSRLAEANGQAREYSDDEEIQEEVRRIRDLVLDMADRYKISDT